MAHAEVEQIGINRLTVDALIRVFGYLDTTSRRRVAAVCSKWRDAIYSTRSLWSCTVPVIDVSTITPRLIDSFIKRGIRTIRVVDASDELDSTAIRALLHQMTSLVTCRMIRRTC